MARIKKFEPGPKIETFDELYYHLCNDSHVYWRDGLMHSSWVKNWSLTMVMNSINGGHFRFACVRDEWAEQGAVKELVW